jgi:hypothetical protein
MEDNPPGVGTPPPLSKKASLARMNSKIDINSSSRAIGEVKEQPSPTPASSAKGMIVQASSRNLTPGTLTAQPSAARMLRSGSVAGRNAISCSLNYPWLLKNANTAGTSLQDYELGRIIGTYYYW